MSADEIVILFSIIAAFLIFTATLARASRRGG